MEMAKSKTFELVRAAICTAATAVLSLITIPLPFSAVPFSLSLLAVFLCGALLEPKWAVTSQLTYLLIGAAGIPVFSGFRGGLSVLVGPTGGFLIAYPLMALTVSLAVKGSGRKNMTSLLCGMAAAIVICYALGASWLMLSTGMSVAAALSAAVLPFIIPDILKAFIAAAAARAVAIRFGK